MSDMLAVTDDGKDAQREAIGAVCDWLQSIGFKVEADPMAAQENDCKWYAWRQLPPGTRDCELNDKPPSLIVKPYLYTMRDRQYASVEVSTTGQCGEWFTLKAYSVSVDDLRPALPRIEAALTRAWGALADSAAESGTLNSGASGSPSDYRALPNEQDTTPEE